MENFDANVQSLVTPVGWTTRIAREPETLVAWAYALGCGEIEVAHAMLKLLGVVGARSSENFPASFEDHVETELRHGEWLHRAVAIQRRSFKSDPHYRLIEGMMSQAMESYVRTLLGYAERQTGCYEAQYCMTALALGSRIFRHSSELSRECGSLELSKTLSQIVEEEARHARTAQVVLGTLPRETRGIYRSVRAFEEILFERMIRKLSRALQVYERSVSKRPANPRRLARCV